MVSTATRKGREMELHERVLVEPGESVPSNRHERTLPKAARMISALRQIGYSFEQAIADLIDNSINAKASAILVRFVCRDDQIQSIIVGDNGIGMSEEALREAMRFGSERDLTPASLGKYGMGLKLASLSFARSLTVLSRHANRSCGRRWTIRGIEKGWDCDVFTEAVALNQIKGPWGPLNLATHGTVVVWEALDKLSVSSAGLRATLRSLAKRLETHLGLCFHRFLDERKVSIYLDQQTEGQAPHSYYVAVTPLDPFAYPASGSREYPKTFRTTIPGSGALNLEAHIWPPNSELPQYKLGNKAAARQGFYFYRNGRLIQSGGWNGLVQHDTEQHSSLARVKIELPSELDDAFGLNVQKSAVVVPPGFELAVAAATSLNGQTFDTYRRAAQQLYRHKDVRAHKSRPLIPGEGLPRDLAEIAKSLLLTPGTRARDVGFEWRKLTTDSFLELDRKRRIISLNSDYRHQLLAGRRPGKTDLPMLKILIYLLTADDFDGDRISSKRKQRLDLLNALLVRAAAYPAASLDRAPARSVRSTRTSRK